MTPTNDAPVAVEQCDIDRAAKCFTIEGRDCDRLREHFADQFARHRLAALASAPAEPAWHTDLGGLIEARRIAQAAYKDIERVKARNTHVPGNPYDVALAALNPALGMLAVLVEQAASAPAGDGDIGLLEAARDLMDAHKRLGGAAEYRADLWACLEENVQRLGRPRAAVECSCMEIAGEDPDCVLHGAGTLWSKENPDICEWSDRMAEAKRIIDRPRAAVGEREAHMQRVLEGCRATFEHIAGRGGAFSSVARADIEAIDLALQSPTAKVEE